MKRVLTAVVLIPLVLLLIFKAPTWGIGMVVAVVGFFSVREYLQLLEKFQFGCLRKTTWGVWAAWAAVLVVIPLYGEPGFVAAVIPVWMFFASLPLFVLYMVLAMGRDNLATGLPAAAVSFAAFFYILQPLGILVSLSSVPDGKSGWFLLVFLLLVVWAGDIAGLYVGRTIGRHALAPRISPKKTWEGSVGSFLGSMFVGTVWFAFAAQISAALGHMGLTSTHEFDAGFPHPLLTGIILSGLVNVFAQLGDLVESLIKRGAGVKDSGAILPGHGGMLDRIDALLFAAPVVWYYAIFLLFPPRA